MGQSASTANDPHDQAPDSTAHSSDPDATDDTIAETGHSATQEGGDALPTPSVRYQPALSLPERKVLRSKAETMAKEKRLQKLQVGVAGITHNLLVAAMDQLQVHSFLRIRLGEGCGLERKAASKQLEELLDAVAVHQIGFTVTLYRQKGLPRPSSLSGVSAAAGADTDAGILDAAAQMRAAAAAAAASRKEQRLERQAKAMAARPPEFQLL